MIRWDQPDDARDGEELSLEVDELDEYDEFDDGDWELDPNDPTHPDHDLSESAPYSWEPPKPIYMRRGVLLLVTALVIVAMLLPAFAIIF